MAGGTRSALTDEMWLSLWKLSLTRGCRQLAVSSVQCLGIATGSGKQGARCIDQWPVISDPRVASMKRGSRYRVWGAGGSSQVVPTPSLVRALPVATGLVVSVYGLAKVPGREYILVGENDDEEVSSRGPHHLLSARLCGTHSR